MVPAINQLTRSYGVGPMFIGNISDQQGVSAFCLEVVGEVFQDPRI